jgi:hypothetical protein
MPTVIDSDSSDYFRRRERAERAAAKIAVTEAARRAHQELAQQYAAMQRSLSSPSLPQAPR